MALSATEQTVLFDGFIAEYGEDYPSLARIVRVLRTVMPAIDWIAVLRRRAEASSLFAQTGLSVAWWVETIDQMSKAG